MQRSIQTPASLEVHVDTISPSFDKDVSVCGIRILNHQVVVKSDVGDTANIPYWWAYREIWDKMSILAMSTWIISTLDCSTYFDLLTEPSKIRRENGGYI